MDKKRKKMFKVIFIITIIVISGSFIYLTSNFLINNANKQSSEGNTALNIIFNPTYKLFYKPITSTQLFQYKTRGYNTGTGLSFHYYCFTPDMITNANNRTQLLNIAGRYWSANPQDGPEWYLPGINDSYLLNDNNDKAFNNPENLVIITNTFLKSNDGKNLTQSDINNITDNQSENSIAMVNLWKNMREMIDYFNYPMDLIFAVAQHESSWNIYEKGDYMGQGEYRSRGLFQVDIALAKMAGIDYKYLNYPLVNLYVYLLTLDTYYAFFTNRTRSGIPLTLNQEATIIRSRLWWGDQTDYSILLQSSHVSSLSESQLISLGLPADFKGFDKELYGSIPISTQRRAQIENVLFRLIICAHHLGQGLYFGSSGINPELLQDMYGNNSYANTVFSYREFYSNLNL